MWKPVDLMQIKVITSNNRNVGGGGVRNEAALWADTETEKEHTLDGSPVHHRADTQRQTISHAHTQPSWQFSVTISLTCMFTPAVVCNVFMKGHNMINSRGLLMTERAGV